MTSSMYRTISLFILMMQDAFRVTRDLRINIDKNLEQPTGNSTTQAYRVLPLLRIILLLYKSSYLYQGIITMKV